MDSITYRASSRRPCPVCGAGSKSCSATSDGLHFCRGEARDGWRRLGEDDNGFAHYRRDDEPPARPAPKPAAPKRPTDWPVLAARYAEALAGAPAPSGTPGRGARPALRRPSDAFTLGLCGSAGGAATFSIPERDGEGTVVGLMTRIERDGGKAEKKCVKSSKRGLTIPEGWRDAPGPVLLVEGFSDAAALTAAGLCAVGRPTTAGRNTWPGFWRTGRPSAASSSSARTTKTAPASTGAVRVAAKLSEALGRRVPFALPPADAKDARQWLTDETRWEAAWMDRGAELLDFLEANLRDPDAAEPELSGTGAPPEILIKMREWHVNAQACAALGREPDIYQRGGLLVHVVEQGGEPETDAAVRRQVGAVSVRELAKPLLRERLTHCARWTEWRGQGDNAQKVAAHPPDWSISAFHVRADWPAIRRLEAVVTHPVLLGDGKVLGANGYDRGSALLIRMPHGLTVTVHEQPTKADVAAAVAELCEVIRDFPFETPAHRAAWIASLLTPLAWFGFDGSAPMFLIDSNIRGGRGRGCWRTARRSSSRAGASP